MAKQGTYFIVGALAMMLAPYILSLLGAYELCDSPVFPQTAMILGGIGVVFHVWAEIKAKSINTSGVLLLTSILAIIYGFSLNALGVKNAQYLLLIGTLLVAVWIIVPANKKKQ